METTPRASTKIVPAAWDCGTRRNFIERVSRGVSSLVACGACGLLQGCTVPVRTFRARPSRVVEVPASRYPELDHRGGMIKVLVGRGGAFIRSEGDGNYTAFSAVCTHQGCLVDAGRDSFNCPCHGSVYDREGKNIAGPAPRPLARLRAQREGEVLKLFLQDG